MQSVDWWSVKWGRLPKDKIHGILRGYRLIYYMSYRSDIPIGGEVKPVVIEMDNFTFYYEARDLVNYATYNVTVTGYTNAGIGPAPEVFASKPFILIHPYQPNFPVYINVDISDQLHN